MKHEMSNCQHLLMVKLLGIELTAEDEAFIRNEITSNPPVIPKWGEGNTLEEYQAAMTFNYRVCIKAQGHNIFWRRPGDEETPGIVFRTTDDYLSVYPLAK